MIANFRPFWEELKINFHTIVFWEELQVARGPHGEEHTMYLYKYCTIGW